MTHKTKAISYDVRIRAFWTLVAICILSLAVYMYAVNMTIRNTALRQELEAEVSQLAIEQGALEFAYIKKSQEISLDLAYEYGFKDVAEPQYVSRTNASALTLHTR